MKVHLALAAVALLLSGCASLYEPVPDGFKGPTAQVADSGFSESSGKAQFFVLREVDGKAIRDTILASRMASHGQGFALSPVYVTRDVPAVPMKVKLMATHQTGAPAHEIASRVAGTFFSVEGVVDFTPVAGAKYVVKGELKKEGSSVWIEDEATHQLVTEKVVSKP